MSGLERHRKALAEQIGLDRVPAIITRALNKAEIGVFEVRSENPVREQSGSLPFEDAYVVALMLQDFPSHQYWEQGRPAPRGAFQAGQIALIDLKRDPKFLKNQSFHSLNFHMSRAVFDGLADDNNVPRIGDLNYQPGGAMNDDILQDLGNLLIHGLSHPERVSRVFLEHVTLAAAAHVAHTYGGMRMPTMFVKGGLASWQLRRSAETLAAHLDGSVTLKSLADECGLSTGHFTRAFRKSTGLTPYQWLAHRRIEKAKDLLRQRHTSLREIALACGFYDQSHLTNVFTRMVGISPGAWQRNFHE